MNSEINKIFKFVIDQKVYLPIIYITIGIISYFIIVSIINKISKNSNKHINQKKKDTIVSLIKNITKYLITILVVLGILNVYGVNTATILASIGIVGLIIGLAFQDIIKDFLAGIFIIFDNQYVLGDNVKINGFRGDVIEVGLKTTKVRAYTGEILIISNSKINEVINYSDSFSKLILDLKVEYDINIDKLERVLRKCQDEFTKLESVKKVEMLGIEEFSDSFIKYRLVIDCEPLMDFGIKRKVLRIIKEEFEKNNIAIPYQKINIKINSKEG